MGRAQHRRYLTGTRPPQPESPLTPVFNDIPVSTHLPDMSDYLSTTTHIPPTEEFGQCAPSRKVPSSLPLFRSSTHESIEPASNGPHSPIHTLNDDALLNIFYLYRLDIPGEYDEDGELNDDWSGQRWWYKLAQVCRRWRYLILASPSRLDLHLLCTYGVPIVDMLAHSPSLPLAINYWVRGRETTEEDEEGILLALRHSDRAHYIALLLPTPVLRKIITTMDEQFPILERFYIASQTEGDTSLVLPRTFQAPHLRHFFLFHVALPIGSPLLTTAVGLVSLWLDHIPPSAYFPPAYLLTRLSLMPQLEQLLISFHSPLPNRDVERQLLDTPITMHITLPNLRLFWFKGVSAYLEGLLTPISTPVLSTLQIQLFSQLTFTVPHLLQFMDDTSATLSFSTVQLDFNNDSILLTAPRGGQRDHPSGFWLEITCRHLDWQVSSAAQILPSLQPLLSAVERLTLSHKVHSQSSEWHNKIDRIQWRQLLRPFSNLNALHVQDELVERIADSLQSDDGEPPLELLPTLKELGYSGGDDARDAFTSFMDERQVAGHPVNLTMINYSELWD